MKEDLSWAPVPLTDHSKRNHKDLRGTIGIVNSGNLIFRCALTENLKHLV